MPLNPPLGGLPSFNEQLSWRQIVDKLTHLSQFPHKVNTNSFYTVKHKEKETTNKINNINETERGFYYEENKL